MASSNETTKDLNDKSDQLKNTIVISLSQEKPPEHLTDEAVKTVSLIKEPSEKIGQASADSAVKPDTLIVKKI